METDEKYEMVGGGEVDTKGNLLSVWYAVIYWEGFSDEENSDSKQPVLWALSNEGE